MANTSPVIGSINQDIILKKDHAFGTDFEVSFDNIDWASFVVKTYNNMDGYEVEWLVGPIPSKSI